MTAATLVLADACRSRWRRVWRFAGSLLAQRNCRSRVWLAKRRRCLFAGFLFPDYAWLPHACQQRWLQPAALYVCLTARGFNTGAVRSAAGAFTACTRRCCRVYHAFSLLPRLA